MDALDQAMTDFGAKAPAGDALDAAMTSYASKPRLVKTAPQAQNDPGMMKVIGNGLVKGAAGFGDMIGNGLVNVGNLGLAAYGTAAHAVTGRANSMPSLIDPDTLSGYRKMADAAGLTSDSREPVNGPQRVADFTAQVIGGGGVNPRALSRAVLNGKIVNPLVQLATPVLGGTAGGVTSEVVRNTIDPDTTLGRAAGAVLPLVAQIAGSYPTAHMSPAGTRAAQTTQNVTPEQWAAAKVLGAKAAAMGAPISATEAIQAVTGNNPGLQSLQRVTEQSGPGVTKLAPAFAQRPAQNATLFGKVADSIHPNEAAPDALAGLLQSAAERSIKSVQDARSAEAGPFYQAQRASDLQAMNLQEQVPALAQNVQGSLQSRAGAMQTSGKLLGLQNDMTQTARDYHPVAGMPGFPARYLPHTDVAAQAGQGAQEAQQIASQRLADANSAQAKLDLASDTLAQKNLPAIQGKVGDLLSQIDAQIRAAGPTVEGAHLLALRNEIAPNGVPIAYPSQLESVYRNNRNKLDIGPFSSAADRTQAGVLGPHVQSLNDLIQSVSPDIAQGRAAYAAASKAVVDPMKFGQVGKLAQSDNFLNQAGTLLPQAPMDVTPGVIDKTAQTIGAQDPTILPRFTAQYLRGTFNEANQDLQNGANQQGGAKFAARVAGNDMQAQNLTQILKSSGANPAGLLDAIDVWKAQGTRPAPGSATTFNNGETSLLSGGFLSAAGSPLKIPGLLAEKAAYSTSTKDLANALFPDAGSVGRLQDLARSNGSFSPMSQAVGAAALKAGNNANQPQQLTYDDYLREYDAAPDAATKLALGQKYAALLSSPQPSEAASQ